MTYIFPTEVHMPESIGGENIYIYIYIYIHTHTHTHTHIYIYIYIYIYRSWCRLNWLREIMSGVRLLWKRQLTLLELVRALRPLYDTSSFRTGFTSTDPDQLKPNHILTFCSLYSPLPRTRKLHFPSTFPTKRWKSLSSEMSGRVLSTQVYPKLWHLAIKLYAVKKQNTDYIMLTAPITSQFW